jgi:hypothetical protein
MSNKPTNQPTNQPMFSADLFQKDGNIADTAFCLVSFSMGLQIKSTTVYVPLQLSFHGFSTTV